VAYSDNQWDKAKAYYEAGLSLSKIKDKTGIARNTISQRAKREQWEQGANADYIEAREIIAEKKGTILEQQGQVFLNALDEVAEDNIRRKGLVYGNAEKLAKKLSIMADQIDTPNDLKTLSEANDRLAITLKVADRHAPKIELNNTNAQQNNNMTKEEIMQAVAEVLPN
jgi:predicted DNA-binding protein YlxM (UPF0122 family)